MCIIYLRLKNETRKYSSEYLQMHNYLMSCVNFFFFFLNQNAFA